MSISHVSLFIKKIVALVAMVLPVLVLAGCSTSLSSVQTWEGSEPVEGIAQLETPGDLRVARVNDYSVSNFLLDDLNLDYRLLPGNQRVELTYRSIWAKRQKTENNESPVHVVASEPQVIHFMAEAGQTYRLVTGQEPGSRREAEVFAAAPQISLVNDSGEVIARAAPVESALPETVERESERNDRLEALKSHWKSATAEERQRFLRWALD